MLFARVNNTLAEARSTAFHADRNVQSRKSQPGVMFVMNHWAREIHYNRTISVISSFISAVQLDTLQVQILFFSDLGKKYLTDRVKPPGRRINDSLHLIEIKIL